MATQVQATPQRGRSFYVAMAVISAAIVFAGFSRAFYFNSTFARRDLTWLMILHGIIFSSWLVLLIAQTSLVAANRTDIHRRLGVVGAILAALMVTVGFTLAIHAAKYGFLTPGLPPPLIFFVVPFFDIIVFSILVGAALYYRKKPDTHKRLVLVATISILPPAFARMPFAFISTTLPFSAFLLGDAVLLGCVFVGRCDSSALASCLPVGRTDLCVVVSRAHGDRRHFCLANLCALADELMKLQRKPARDSFCAYDDMSGTKAWSGQHLYDVREWQNVSPPQFPATA